MNSIESALLHYTLIDSNRIHVVVMVKKSIVPFVHSLVFSYFPRILSISYGILLTVILEAISTL
jgi:hypothetical protein